MPVNHLIAFLILIGFLVWAFKQFVPSVSEQAKVVLIVVVTILVELYLWFGTWNLTGIK